MRSLLCVSAVLIIALLCAADDDVHHEQYVATSRGTPEQVRAERVSIVSPTRGQVLYIPGAGCVCIHISHPLDGEERRTDSVAIAVICGRRC